MLFITDITGGVSMAAILIVMLFSYSPWISLLSLIGLLAGLLVMGRVQRAAAEHTPRVLVGGLNVKDYTADSLLRHISMVFQNVYLFHDTVENNIRFGNPNATHEQVVEAARRARCHEFIMEMPEGYQTVIGEGGSTPSGGEKQRIPIARAILKDAPIVILAEAIGWTLGAKLHQAANADLSLC